MKQYLEAGKAVSTHGVRGELKFYPYCNSPEVLKKLSSLYLSPDGMKSLRLVRVAVQGNMAIVGLEGIDTVEKARAYLNRTFYLDRAELKLPNDSWFVEDLLGASVEDAVSGEYYGEIQEISNNGAHDNLHVLCGDGIVRMMPLVKAFVKEVDVVDRILKVVPIKGMLKDED